MKSLILYESKTGCTEKCANYLNKDNSADISKLSHFKKDINEFDTIVLMSPVYVGKINKKMAKFIERNRELILEKKTIIALCCMNLDGYDEMINANFDDELKNHATIFRAGGAYYFEKLNFFYKKIVRAIANVEKTTEDINYESLNKIKI